MSKFQPFEGVAKLCSRMKWLIVRVELIYLVNTVHPDLKPHLLVYGKSGRQ